MDDEHEQHSSVGKSYEIDQRAIKVFLDWLPDNWLPRKQDPDFYVDFLVEIVESGEPTGKHFGAQIKGFEDKPSTPKPISHPFKTKHLDYYLNLGQHPIFLFLINVTSREGFWIFAQKYLKEQASQKILDEQKSLIIHFVPEDNFFNSAKFKCLLPESEQFVRDLHPGSVQAALQKRKAELEKIDPRCSVLISVEDGKEQITVIPNEVITFSTKINNQNEEDWQNFVERGAKMKIRREDLEFSGAPLMQEALKSAGGEFEIQFGNEIPGALHIISKAEPGKFIPIEGRFRRGTRFFNFHGQLPDSPLSISFEVSWEAAFKSECFNLSVGFSPKNWIGQPILNLAYFDLITTFANAFTGKPNPEMEIFIQGNSALRGALSNESAEMARGVNVSVEWLRKCRWLAKHFKVNPPFPPSDKLGKKRMDALEQLYDLLTQQGVAVPSPNIRFEFLAGKIMSDEAIASSDKNLRIEKPEQTFDFFGVTVHVGPIRHVFTEVEFVSQTQQDDGKVKVVLAGSKNTTRTSSLVSAEAFEETKKAAVSVA